MIARLNLLVWDSQKVQKRKMLFNDRSFGMDLAPQAKPTMVNHPRCRMKQFKFEKCKYHQDVQMFVYIWKFINQTNANPICWIYTSIAQFHQYSFPRSCFLIVSFQMTLTNVWSYIWSFEELLKCVEHGRFDREKLRPCTAHRALLCSCKSAIFGYF